MSEGHKNTQPTSLTRARRAETTSGSDASVGIREMRMNVVENYVFWPDHGDGRNLARLLETILPELLRDFCILLRVSLIYTVLG